MSDKPLQKPSEDESAEKIKHLLGENITKLLGKYEKDNQALGKLAKILHEEPLKPT